MTSDRHDNLWQHSHQAGLDASAWRGDIQTDLLVIGGGFTGCSAALEAAQSGAGVVLLEAKTVGHGGSGRNVGLVNAGLWLPPDDIIETLGSDDGTRLIAALSGAPDLVFRLVEKHAITCEATRNGTLHLAHASSGLMDLQSRFQQGNRTGAPLQLLDAAETARRTGSKVFHGSLFDPRAGTVQPLAYCRGLARAAQAAGAQIFEDASVSEILYDGELWTARTKGQRIQARRLLLATNAYGTGMKGAPAPQFVPVHFSQFATAPLSQADRRHILPGGEGCWDTDMVMSSLRIDRDGRLIIGGVGDVTGPGAAVHRKWAARKLAHLFPEVAGTQFDYAWSGAIAMTSNHLPKILSFGPNALSVFGYSGRGIGPGTLFGKQAARALLFDEYDSLPVPVTETYTEWRKGPRTAYYELGAIMSHATRPGLF